MRRLARLLPVLVLALVPLAFARTADAQAATTLKLPFAAGTSWKVLQGYNGGTHAGGPERFALDLVRDGEGGTANVEVLAPAAGAVWYMNPPGAGNGCLSIKLDTGGGLIVMMCHIFARPFRIDERVEAGQVVGTIGPNGTVGNNGAAHVHMSLHRTPDYGQTRIPAPFAAPDGLTLDGGSLPSDGTPNQYGCPSASCRGAMVSTNGRAGGAPVAGPAPSTPIQAAAPPAAGSFAAPVAASFTAPAAGVAVVPLAAGVRARVAGTGDCVNVRQAPGIGAPLVTCLADGTAVTVAQGPLPGDGRNWWRIEGLGWAAGEYLSGTSAPPATVRVGAGVVVDAGQGDCLNLRETPGVAATPAACLLNGARLTVTDGPREADGRTWWHLDGRGWAVGEFLRLFGG